MNRKNCFHRVVLLVAPFAALAGCTSGQDPAGQGSIPSDLMQTKSDAATDQTGGPPTADPGESVASDGESPALMWGWNPWRFRRGTGGSTGSGTGGASGPKTGQDASPETQGTGGASGTGGATGAGGASGSGGATGAGGSGTGGSGTGGSGTGGSTGGGFDGAADVKRDGPRSDGSPDAVPPPPLDATSGRSMLVANGQIFDRTGALFLPWGVNKVHVDQANAGLELTGTNAVRVNLYFRLPNATTTSLFDRFYAANIVVIPGRWEATCVGDGSFATVLASEVDAWVAEATAWKKYESASMINIANEAGPENSTVWRDQYIIAVGRMRAAGYGGLLMIDSGGCGQDVEDIAKYGAAVLAADPMHNIVFSLHVYGVTPNVTTLNSNLDRLKATGLSIVIGEFGPGRNIGPSPTNLAPADVMASALARGIGTLAWAADDNNLSNSMADDTSFSMFYDLGKPYTGDAADLTIFGKVVVNDPAVGLRAIAKKAGGF